MAAERGRSLSTAIEDLGTFTLAEDYHQKYRLRQLPGVEQEYLAIYPELSDFVRSTAVTRVNALLGGALERERFLELAPELGLSPAALDELRRRVR